MKFVNLNRIYIYYSGGKDASLLIDFFLEYRRRNHFTYEIVLLTIKYPYIIYDSNIKEQMDQVGNAINYWTSQGIIHKWINVDVLSDDILKNNNIPCSLCEGAKINAMDKEMENEEYNNAYICLGHTLDDIVGYFSEIFYIAGSFDNWREIQKNNPILFERLLKLSRWIYLTYRPYGLQSSFTYLKPLMLIEEELISKIVQEERYPLIQECCAEMMGNEFILYKRIVNKGISYLNSYYREDEDISKKLLHKNYDMIFNFYQKNGLLPTLDYIESVHI